MFPVYILVCIPLSREEWILFTDYFAIEKRGERRKFVSQPFDFQVSAQVRVLFVHVLKSQVNM